MSEVSSAVTPERILQSVWAFTPPLALEAVDSDAKCNTPTALDRKQSCSVSVSMALVPRDVEGNGTAQREGISSTINELRCCTLYGANSVKWQPQPSRMLQQRPPSRWPARSLEACFSHTPFPRGARYWRMITLAHLYAVDRSGPNHDAVMRIESEAPRRRLHSSRRRDGHVQQRKAATSDRHGIQTALS